ncbi:MAG: FecR domain-containing protein [Armatimonadota bacterium]
MADVSGSSRGRRPIGRTLRAWTLIELLTVLAIIAVLAGIAVPVVGSVRQSARKSKCGANLQGLATALAEFAVQERHYPAHLSELVPEYVSDTSRLHCRNDPIKGRITYDLFYARRATVESDAGIVCACAFHGRDKGWMMRKGGDLEYVTFQSATVHGNSEMRPRESADWVPADGKRVRPGDALRTAKGCAVQFDDGTVLRLRPGTEITIAALCASPDGGSITAVGMYVGEVYAEVKHLLTRNSTFEVVTPSAVTGVRGTSFAVHVPPNGDTDVHVYQGAVRVTTWDGRQYTLKKYQRVHVSGPGDDSDD